jgi:hypothetical protein
MTEIFDNTTFEIFKLRTIEIFWHKTDFRGSLLPRFLDKRIMVYPVPPPCANETARKILAEVWDGNGNVTPTAARGYMHNRQTMC